MPSRFELPPKEYADLCLRVYQRDSWKCRTPLCPARGIAAHHIIYRSAGGGDYSWNLISLCNRCHDAVHSKHLLLYPHMKEAEFVNADVGVRFFFKNGWHPIPSKSKVK